MLKDSIEAMIKGYHQYNAYFLNQWHILNSSSIVPTKAMKAYSEHEHNVMCYEEPIYTLVAYIPCYYLWPWFSYQIMQSLDYAPVNIEPPLAQGSAFLEGDGLKLEISSSGKEELQIWFIFLHGIRQTDFCNMTDMTNKKANLK